MSLLTSSLPKSVSVAGKDVEINTDFRQWLEFSHILTSGGGSLEERTARLLALVYEKMPDNIAAAVEAMFLFFIGGSGNQDKGGKPPKRTIYDFDYDGDYIYAAFLQQYGVNLTTASLHWWQFLAMFNSISDDTQIAKIMQVRATNTGTIKDAAKRREIRKLQARYAIPDMRTQEEKEADFTASFIDAFI